MTAKRLVTQQWGGFRCKTYVIFPDKNNAKTSYKRVSPLYSESVSYSASLQAHDENSPY